MQPSIERQGHERGSPGICLGRGPVGLGLLLSMICCVPSASLGTGLTSGSHAADFAGGTGEPNDPYRIATAKQLILIGSDPNLLSVHFVLVADLDLGSGLPGGRVFTEAVIAPSSQSPFTGSLDGADHAIRNLTIDGVFDLGLFGYVAVSGIVKNLGLETASITGSSNIGGLVASNNGTVSSCRSTGSVTGREGVGGLVGENNGTVSSCSAAVRVVGKGWMVGGLVAWNDGTVSLCHSTGSVTGGLDVGGLVGKNEGTVSSCSATGDVTGERSRVGGLAGSSSGTISGCHATGSVTGREPLGGLVGANELFGALVYCYATGQVTGGDPGCGALGGLAGDNDGTVTSCYATGSVTGSMEVGGLVGSNSLFGAIACCCATGQVTGTDWGFGNVGGLVGDNPGGAVTSCYSTGRVAGPENVGGLVGYSSGTVISCYSTGRATGWVAVGGSVGHNADPGQIADGYFLAPSDGGGPDNGLGTALTAGQMREQGSFIGFDFWGGKADRITADWFMPADRPPVLVWQTEWTGLTAIPDVRGLTPEEARGLLEAAGFVLAVEVQADYDRMIPAGRIVRSYPASYATPGGTIELVVSQGPYVYDWTTNPGDGTVARPYQIQDANQLESLMDRPDLYGRHFLLTANIDLAGRTYSKALIAPDVNDSMDGFQGTAFTGSLDGQGFEIINLRITTRINDYLGLFGSIAKGATVRGVGLVNVRIQGDVGSWYVGTVAGCNAGTITDCSAGGAVTGHKPTGELVGANSGVIERCDTVVSRFTWG